MDYTSVYGLELLVLEGMGGEALATDHRVILELGMILEEATVSLSIRPSRKAIQDVFHIGLN